MEKKMENEMETVVIRGIIGVVVIDLNSQYPPW